ncbi:unnamed protein product [Rangifer tarandus platyrhynchus]|uniref:Uncharacterized protein n=2 Tax=Rangifer tarandus platyrhynchus TaxID=3082113 RepID=A0ACB0F9D0_RANTA|nr:unnamed protein product [Rangifer tarandus platyrhynchus]CAI9709299.1 unnamed protein product [Rangifer tarandus platyrhynchus]
MANQPLMKLAGRFGGSEPVWLPGREGAERYQEIDQGGSGARPGRGAQPSRTRDPTGRGGGRQTGGQRLSPAPRGEGAPSPAPRPERAHAGGAASPRRGGDTSGPPGGRRRRRRDGGLDASRDAEGRPGGSDCPRGLHWRRAEALRAPELLYGRQRRRPFALPVAREGSAAPTP